MTGTIRSLNMQKRFGFIRASDGDYFFHSSALVNEDFEKLGLGMLVSFEPKMGDKGKRAENVMRDGD